MHSGRIQAETSTENQRVLQKTREVEMQNGSKVVHVQTVTSVVSVSSFCRGVQPKHEEAQDAVIY